MKKLETTFAGLNLKNPFIVSSCNLTNSAEKNRRWEEAGAGAIVLKSLFEEEIEAESGWVQEGTHTEEQDYLFAYYRAHRLDQQPGLPLQSPLHSRPIGSGQDPLDVRHHQRLQGEKSAGEHHLHQERGFHQPAD